MGNHEPGSYTQKPQRLNLDSKNIISLPEPRHDGPVSIEKALLTRRSIRAYKNESLSLAELSQLAWAAQGVSSPRGYRTAPSAGALFPLEIYIYAGRVKELSAGVYKYQIRHTLRKIVEGDHRTDLARAALNQRFIAKAPAVFLFCAVYERITHTYGQRGMRMFLWKSAMPLKIFACRQWPGVWEQRWSVRFKMTGSGPSPGLHRRSSQYI